MHLRESPLVDLAPTFRIFKIINAAKPAITQRQEEFQLV